MKNTAIITGSSKGIGYGCAVVFARNGYNVVVVSRNEEEGKNAEEKIASQHGSAFYIRCDVSKEDQVKALIAKTTEAFGRIDTLINNAGYHISKNIEDTAIEEWEYIINTNLRSVFLCTKYAIPYLKKTKGSVINMSSMVGVVGQGNAAAYSSTKGGMIAITKNLALDYAPYGITVNCIAPGWIETPLVDDWFSQQKNESKARKYIYSVHPLGRIGTSEEVGELALFLASKNAKFITGAVVPIDGGVTLGY
jgi:NAD(P)-dependent dehydrogenase (short-subunit alcohol dehydrogenase family)